MTLRPLFQRARNRLLVAILGAVLVHVVVLALGHLGLVWNAIPSDHSRTLTLTLDNTLHEGLIENDQVDEATINDMPLGKAKHVRHRELADEVVSADVLNPEGAQLPSPETKAQRSNISQQVAEQAAVESASPLGEEGATDLHSTSLTSNSNAKERANPSVDDSAIMTASERDLAISSADGTPDLVIAERVSVTESEQRMLDQKIKHWAENLDSNNDFTESVSWQEQGQTYIANFSRIPASGDMDLDQVVVEVVTEKNGETLTTEMRMKKLAFSNFGQFVHRWDRDIAIHDDEMTGRFHSNTRFNLEYSAHASPRFNHKVTTASSRVNLNGPTSKQNIFLGGLEMGVKRIKMPKPKLLFPHFATAEQVAKKDNTVFVETKSRLIFLAHGALRIEPFDNDLPSREIALGDTPTYVISSPKARVYVSGVVNGIVAVYSPNRIVIESNVIYASFSDIQEGGDFLGLISGRDVVIPSRRVTGDGDLTIHAAIYAGRRFEVTQIRGRRAGTLTIHGSVSAGSISATEPRYATNIVFDKRMENARPPGFPVTDRYELAVAQNGWTRTPPIEDADTPAVIEETYRPSSVEF